MTEDNLAEAFNQNNTPFAKMMGVKMTLVTKERIEGELEVTEAHCTIPATLHGGAMMAMADNMGGIGAFMNMPPGSLTTTVESSVLVRNGKLAAIVTQTQMIRPGSA